MSYKDIKQSAFVYVFLLLSCTEVDFLIPLVMLALDSLSAKQRSGYQ